MRFLKWATFLLLIMLVVGIVASYPTLRNRFITPMLAEGYPPPLETQITAASATDLPTSTVSSTINTVLATVRPTLALATARASTALQIIASAPTATPQPSQAGEASASTEVSGELATPPAIATTSLLPASSAAERITPVVLAPSGVDLQSDSQPATGSATSTEETSDSQSAIAATTTQLIPNSDLNATPATTPEVSISVLTTTALTSAQLITTQIITPASTIMVVATVTPIVINPIPAGPFANANSPLYGGPNLTFPVVGQVLLGESLTIIGRYTEGTWYLLASGVWIPGQTVDNAPLALPLVFPTLTPVPSATPTVTPTPLPTETPQTSATPTPTPTSLDDMVCDCSSDNRDCLGNIFANRAEAQRCFEYCFRQTGLDIHLLDPNLNGLACENLP